MSECYPTGCTPCTSPIEFPRKCLLMVTVIVSPLAAMENRNAGYMTSVFLAGVPKVLLPHLLVIVGLSMSALVKPADFNELAGDWLIAEAACAAAHPTWGLNLGAIAIGDRVAYNGTTWQSFPPPDVPYAEEAVSKTDIGNGGIVKLASVEQVAAGTNKCNPITPWTLSKLTSHLTLVKVICLSVLVINISFSYPDGDDDFNANKFSDTTVAADLTDTLLIPGSMLLHRLLLIAKVVLLKLLMVSCKVLCIL